MSFLLKRTVRTVTLLLLCLTVTAQYGGPCLIYGPDFPQPRSPSKASAVKAATAALEQALYDAFAGKNNTYGLLDSGNSSFSADIYSIYETDSIWTYHHTGAAMQNDPVGVKRVDSNTVYALGSVSKMLTTYLFLLEAGDTSYNDPVTKYIPELAAFAKAHPNVGTHQINHVNWNDVTVGALASQLGGISRDVVQNNWWQDFLAAPGWPAPDVYETSMCGRDGIDGFNVACNRSQFFNVFLQTPPTVAPFQTAVYSNDGFTLLGYVLESITGNSLKDLFNNKFVSRLGLNQTYYDVPPTTTHGIIPLSLYYSQWNEDLYESIAAGGYYSTINDMRKIGRSIMSYAYLTPGQTRRWFQPHSFDADERGAIGSPFELFRAPTTERVSWIYTKAGDAGTYNTLVGYIPDFNVGFTILNAFSADGVSGIDVNTVGNAIISIMWPALEAAAKAEAAEIYGATYYDKSTNSTITIATDQYGGLSLTKWTTNGADVRTRYLSFFGYSATDFTRLVPTGLTDSVNGRTTAVGFRLIASKALQVVDTQVVTSTCFNWVEVDALTYGYLGLDQFVFDLDSAGVAKNIQPRAFRQTLPKSK